MDQELLDALNNLSKGLEKIADALENKSGATSATATALTSVDIGEKLTMISDGIKKLQEDNQKILENQKTILEMSKSKKTSGVEEAGTPKQRENIKKGVSSILLIAVGVLAIGGAFKLLGGVDFKSVIALAIALPLVAMAFEKIGQTKMSIGKIAMTVLFMIGISTAIWLSSSILSKVQPVGLFQLITSVFIATAFGALGYGMGQFIKGLEGINLAEAAAIAASLPILLVAISYAIMSSSEYLSKVQPIGLFQFITSLMIAVVFIPIGFAMKYLAQGVSELANDALLIAALPLLLIAFSYAIRESSFILKDVQTIDPGLLFNIVLQGVALAAIGTVMGFALKQIGKGGATTLETMFFGGLGLVIIGASIAATSQLIAMGDYSNAPTVDWAVSAGLSLGAFGLAAFGIGTEIIASGGLGLAALALGGVGVLLVAATIAATSGILSEGNYVKFPPVSWSASLAISMGAFGIGALTLGTAILATFGLGMLALEAGNEAILMIADTIVETSNRLQKGNFTGGPTIEWAGGIALSMGAFAPVYGMLLLNKIFDLFGGGGVGPEDFKNAIGTITDGIIYAAKQFAGVSAFGKSPISKEWAEGVGQAIGAFAPVYAVLAESKTGGLLGLLKGKGPSVEDMKNAIMTISQGIVDAATFFNSPENTGKFDVSKVPTKEWGEGVGNAINAFAPVYKIISDKSGGLWGMIKGEGPSMDDMRNAIISVSQGIVSASTVLSGGNYTVTIPEGYMDSISKNIKTYVDLAKYVSEQGVYDGLFGISSTVRGLFKMATGYERLAESVSKLAGELNKIDTERLLALKNMTGSMVMLSLMDPEQFEKMMSAFEAKAPLFRDVMTDMSGGPGRTEVTPVRTATETKPVKTIDDLYGIMEQVAISTRLIATDSNKLSRYVDEIRGGDVISLSGKK